MQQTKLSLLYQMLRIRKLQLRIESEYHLDQMKTPVHLCIGQEAVAVGVCASLRRDDFISSNHRGHGHYLAKGGDLKGLVAELYGRSTGCSRGRGGSMHLVDTSVGHIGSSSIVGGGIPIATGLALAIQLRGLDRVSTVFFGDGAADEGVLYESINFAMLKRLPVIYVLENNGYSVCSPGEQRQCVPPVFHGVPHEHLSTARVDGNSVLDVLAAASEAVRRARSGDGPSLIECRTYRMRGHAGAGTDVHLGYRSAEEIAKWQERCPLEQYARQLVAEGLLTDASRAETERRVESEIEQAFRFAAQSPLPEPDELPLYLFHDEQQPCPGPGFGPS